MKTYKYNSSEMYRVRYVFSRKVSVILRAAKNLNLSDPPLVFSMIYRFFLILSDSHFAQNVLQQTPFGESRLKQVQPHKDCKRKPPFVHIHTHRYAEEYKYSRNQS